MFRPQYILVALYVLTSASVFFGQTQLSALPDSRSVISYLNESISWYRHFSVEQQLATEPRDVLFINENRELADQIIRFSFGFAKSEALSLEPDVTGQDQTVSPTEKRTQSLQIMTAEADQQVEQLQGEVDSLRDKQHVAKRKSRDSLGAAVAQAQSELEMAETHRDTLRMMIEFASSAGKGSEGNTFRAQVEQLERTVPAVNSLKNAGDQGGEQPSAAQATNVAGSQKEPSGIIARVQELIALSRKSQSLGEAIQLTKSLAESGKNLRTPLTNALKQGTQRGNEITNRPDSTDPALMKNQKAELDNLIAQYKQYSTAALPLVKQGVLLDQYQSSLTDWRDAVRDEYKSALGDLAMRLGVVAAVLIVLFASAEMGRRAIFRYAPDQKRRYQFLLLRRIVIWSLIVIIVAVAFARQLGSLATFAGLLTAGVAFALQNVILSIVGYFLLIGKYGIRVGDRVQIAGVTGEVVEVGIVRLHLMESRSGDSDAQPTGRVVAFPNSVVFQPTGGVFKQIPGTNFVWHEITLTLAPESDYHAVEQRLLSAVESVYSEYRDSIERQRKHLEKTVRPIAAGSLNPQSRLRLTESALKVVIRYPLDCERASVLDDRITREVLDAIERPPKLKLVGAGAANIQQPA